MKVMDLGGVSYAALDFTTPEAAAVMAAHAPYKCVLLWPGVECDRSEQSLAPRPAPRPAPRRDAPPGGPDLTAWTQLVHPAVPSHPSTVAMTR